MVKTKRNYIIAILVIAVLTLSVFMSAVAVFGGKNTPINMDIPELSSMTNIDIKDDNGKVDAPITSGGVAIATAAELKNFLRGNNEYGYLTGNITNFYWEKLATDKQGASNIEFAKGRTLDGNGYTINMGLDNSVTDPYPMITNQSAVALGWTAAVKASGGALNNNVSASSLLIAVNQGTIKNLNMEVMLDKAQNLEWIPSGGRNSGTNEGQRNSNTRPLFFGFMTGVNFGYINNSTVHFKAESQPFSLGSGNLASIKRWAKEEENDMEFGGFAGVNCGEISYVTANIGTKIDIKSLSSSRDHTALGVNSGNASARAIYGGIVGRMQSDPMAEPNKVNITSASLTNSIIAGDGEAYVHSKRNGSGGVLYNHVGAAVGSNSPYSGTVIDPVRRQSYGIVDGMISSYTGSLTRENIDSYETAGSTSGAPPSQTFRAIVDCGKISNVTFADRYDGHIDNCGCVGGEHIATRANGIRTVYGEGDLTMSFSRGETSTASLIFEITPTKGVSGVVDDNVIYAVTKRDRSVKDGNNMTTGAGVALFNYDSEGYYSQYSDSLKQTSKRATIEVTEPRSGKDINSYILELEFGRQVKAMYETSTDGRYTSYDDKLGRDITTFAYDGSEKGNAKIIALQDGEGEDTFAEKTSVRQFKSKYRSENQSVDQAIDYTMDLIYSGIYTEIYIQSTISPKHAYVDAALRIVAPLETNDGGKIITKEFKITPAHIVAQNDTEGVSIGGDGIDKDDIDTSKLFATTFASFDFGFSVFAISQSGSRKELKKSTSGSGANQVTVYPYDRIEYSDDGYIFKTALTYKQFEAGEKFVANKSTHPTSGRSYYFRAVKELRDVNGALKFETTVTLDSKSYTIKIDGEAPKVNAKIVGGDNAGMDFLKWSERNDWKKSAFTLEFNIDESTQEGLEFYKKLSGLADSSGIPVTLSGKNVTETFSDDKIYVYYAFDKYKNRSKDYIVASKIDAVTPEFTFSGSLREYSAGGELIVDGAPVSDKTIINKTIIANRTVELSVDFSRIGASGATSYYKINNSEWIKMSGNTIVVDKVVNAAYYLNDGSVDKTIFDKIAIKTVSGVGLEIVSAIEYEVQVNKSIILVDKDTIVTNDGFIVTTGIRREHVTKTYTSNTALSKGLIETLNNAINDKLADMGETRTAENRIYVEGHYATANVGDEIPIIIKVIDPLDVYTINANLMDLRGYIAPALINVTVNSATREYGRANPKFTYEISGLLGGDTIDLSAFISAPNSVTIDTPVSADGIKLNVPTKGYSQGNYRIGSVDSTNAKLYIKAQKLTEITYDDAYLDFAYNGEEHFVRGTYRLPSGVVANLDVKYYKHGVLLEGAPIDIGEYTAVFTIDDSNYILDPLRATIVFEVHKGFVNIDVKKDQLELKFNGAERQIEPKLSNESTPRITYYNDKNELIHDGITGYYPMNAGTYTVHVEYNNDIDDDSKKGKYYSNLSVFTMTISKVAMADSGMLWENVDKRYNGQKSQVIVKNIPTGTTIPDGLLRGEEEGSYILLERTDVGEESKKFAFKNPNIIEQELVAKIKIGMASFDDFKVKLDSLETVFDNMPHSIRVDNLPSGVDVSVRTVTGTTEGVELDSNYAVTKTAAGTYRIRVQVANANFATKELTATLYIAKANVTTVKTEALNVIYDGAAHSAIITDVPSDVNMDSKTTVEIIFAGGGNERYFAIPMNAERTIWQTPSKISSGRHMFRALIVNANYMPGIAVVGQVNIEQAYYSDFGTTAENVNVVYDGAEKVLKLNNIPAETVFQDALGNIISGEIRATDAGVYTLDVYLSNPNMAQLGNHFKATLTIEPKENTKAYVLNGVTVDYELNKTIEIMFDINQLDPGFTVEFNPLDGMVINGNTLSFSNAGTYDIIGYVVNKNYLPRQITAQVVINKIIAPYGGEVVIGDQTVIFNGFAQAPTIEGLDESTGAIVRITYSGAIIIGGVPINAGKYSAKVTISHMNYIDIVKDIIFTIAPATIEDIGYKIANAAFIYDGASHGTQVIDGNGAIASGYTFKLTYGDLAEGEMPINAGSYIVSGILSKPNYQDLIITNVGTVDIIKAKSPELNAKDIDAKYNGKAQKIKISALDGSSMGEYTVQVLRNGLELVGGIVDVGEYDCTLIITQQNYTTSTLSIKVKISPKAVTITYTNIESPIVDGKFVLTGTYKDVNGVDQYVTFDFPEGFTGATGKYTVGVRISDPNYVPTEETANVAFEIKGTNVGAIVGGAGGGAAVVGIGAVLFFVLKKKKISL